MKKHKWITEDDEYGRTKGEKADTKPYLFAAKNLGSEYHNGPRCKVCNFEFCYHCYPEGYKTECGTKSLGSDDSKLDGSIIALDRSIRSSFGLK